MEKRKMERYIIRQDELLKKLGITEHVHFIFSYHEDGKLIIEVETREPQTGDSGGDDVVPRTLSGDTRGGEV